MLPYAYNSSIDNNLDTLLDVITSNVMPTYFLDSTGSNATDWAPGGQKISRLDLLKAFNLPISLIIDHSISSISTAALHNRLSLLLCDDYDNYTDHSKWKVGITPLSANFEWSSIDHVRIFPLTDLLETNTLIWSVHSAVTVVTRVGSNDVLCNYPLQTINH